MKRDAMHDLPGYLFNNLDPDSRRAVEADLGNNPDARRRLDALRRLTAPLAGPAPEPPPGLADRCLARIRSEADGGGNGQPPLKLFGTMKPAPKPTPAQKLGHHWPWYRRADGLVAAAIVLVFLGISGPLVVRATRLQQIYACQNNLREFHTALVSYSDTHNGEFPRVEESPPRNVAGIFVPILNEAGVLPTDVSVTCPGRRKPQAPGTQTVEELERLCKTDPEEYKRVAREMACCYAYSLGYRDEEGRHAFVRRASGVDNMPILGDRPATAGDEVQPGNSPNHRGKGQNVLFVDGHVQWCPHRGVGAGGDDIFLNDDNRPGAGRHKLDTVLGPSWASPYPGREE